MKTKNLLLCTCTVFKYASYLILFGLVTAQIAFADSILPVPKKISAHVYAWIGPYGGPSKTNQGFRMNMAFVVGENAVAVIDSGYTEAMAVEIVRHIRKITSVPIKIAINSNSQPHRFMGNTVFRNQGAQILAHPLSEKRMRNMSGVFIGGIERALELPKDSVKFPALPDILLEKPRTIDLGGTKILIRNGGASHTPASLIIEIPDDKVVYAGDILFSDRLLAVLPDGNIKSWIATFNQLRLMGDVVFIPGHGEPDRLTAFEFATFSYLRLLHEHMVKKVEEGADVQDAINSLDQSAYKDLVDFEQLSGRNASWAYLETEAAAFQ